MQSDFCVAVHALVFLHHKDCVLSSEALADNICTNAARVRKVLAKLKTAGLVETKEGNVGGYRLKQPASQISLTKVADALQIRFVDTNWYSGDLNKPCQVASGMSGIMSDLLEDLDRCCRDKLENKTVADINIQIFGA